MLWPEADAALCVAMFMIPAERIPPRFRRRLVEPDLWKKPAKRFDPGSSGALALVGNDGDMIAGVAERAFVTDVENLVVRRAIMREPELRAVRPIAFGPQPV